MIINEYLYTVEDRLRIPKRIALFLIISMYVVIFIMFGISVISGVFYVNPISYIGRMLLLIILTPCILIIRLVIMKKSMISKKDSEPYRTIIKIDDGIGIDIVLRDGIIGSNTQSIKYYIKVKDGYMLKYYDGFILLKTNSFTKGTESDLLTFFKTNSIYKRLI